MGEVQALLVKELARRNARIRALCEAQVHEFEMNPTSVTSRAREGFARDILRVIDGEDES